MPIAQMTMLMSMAVVFGCETAGSSLPTNRNADYNSCQLNSAPGFLELLTTFSRQRKKKRYSTCMQVPDKRTNTPTKPAHLNMYFNDKQRPNTLLHTCYDCVHDF